MYKSLAQARADAASRVSTAHEALNRIPEKTEDELAIPLARIDCVAALNEQQALEETSDLRYNLGQVAAALSERNPRAMVAATVAASFCIATVVASISPNSLS